MEGARVEAAPGGNPSGGARRQAGWLLLHTTKRLILSSQHKRQGLAFTLYQTRWNRSHVGLWMLPNQAPHPASLVPKPGKESDKGNGAKIGGTGSKNTRDAPQLLQSPAP